jgi:tRNA dimethylallyltransferase
VKALFLLGPTASGKTAAALALADKLPIEIVSVDSAQVFRGMDIGTAKPSVEERAQAPHHLIDILEPTESYSAGRFRDDALRLVSEIHSRGAFPVLAGGTMLYFSALVRGLADLPQAQPGIRAQIEREAAESGWPAVHAELARVDPPTARRIEPTDSQRIERALEVFRYSGKPLSEWHAETRSRSLPFDALKIALEPGHRAALHERIAVRFRQMVQNGLLAEVRGLRERHRLDAAMPSMRAVGYRQAWDTLEGRAAEETLEERGIAATRQLAKRQLTWLRSMPDLERIDCLRPDLTEAVTARVLRFVQSSP